jgi:hypothetical protein
LLDVVVTCSGCFFAIRYGLLNHRLGFPLAVEELCAGGLGHLESLNCVVGVGGNKFGRFFLA